MQESKQKAKELNPMYKMLGYLPNVSSDLIIETEIQKIKCVDSICLAIKST